MDFIFILLGINIFGVFLFKREWLIRKKPFALLFTLNLLLFASGYLLQYLSIGNPAFVIALKIPIFSQLLFLGLLIIFYKIYNRDPVDGFWTMDVGLLRESMFNFIFVVAFTIPVILVLSGVI